MAHVQRRSPLGSARDARAHPRSARPRGQAPARLALVARAPPTRAPARRARGVDRGSPSHCAGSDRRDGRPHERRLRAGVRGGARVARAHRRARAVSIVPGNHDAYVAIPREKSWDHWSEFLRSDPLPGASGGTHDDFPTLRVRGGLAFVGLSSAQPTPLGFATGSLGVAQLERLERLLADLSDSPLCRILLLHHPPTPDAVSARRALGDAKPCAACCAATASIWSARARPPHADRRARGARGADSGGGGALVVRRRPPPRQARAVPRLRHRARAGRAAAFPHPPADPGLGSGGSPLRSGGRADALLSSSTSLAVGSLRAPRVAALASRSRRVSSARQSAKGIPSSTSPKRDATSLGRRMPSGFQCRSLARRRRSRRGRGVAIDAPPEARDPAAVELASEAVLVAEPVGNRGRDVLGRTAA